MFLLGGQQSTRNGTRTGNLLERQGLISWQAGPRVNRKGQAEIVQSVAPLRWREKGGLAYHEAAPHLNH